MTSESPPSTANGSPADQAGTMRKTKVAPASPPRTGESASPESTDGSEYVSLHADMATGTLEGRYNSQAAAERAARLRIRRLLGQ